MARPMPLAAPVITATRPATERFPWVSLVMSGDHTAGVLTASLLAASLGAGVAGAPAPDPVDFSAGSVLWALVLACLAAIPLGVSLWALLDVARRPRWAWALAERRQVLWLALIMLGVFSVVGGLVISGWYLLRVRPVVAAAEAGHF